MNVLCYGRTIEWLPQFLILKSDGKLNLPSGTVADDETWDNGTRRIFKEAVGLDAHTVTPIGTLMMANDTTVMECRYFTGIPPRDCEHLRFDVAVKREDLQDYLRFVIPLCMAGVKGWSMVFDAAGGCVGVDFGK